MSHPDVFKGVALFLLLALPLICGSTPLIWSKLGSSMVLQNSFVGGFLIGVAALHLLADATHTINEGSSAFGVAFAFSCAMLSALLIDERVRYSAYRWLPTEDQLKPSCYGEIVFPMLFDGTNDTLSSVLLFLGLTLQYILAGITIGCELEVDVLTFLGILMYKILASISLGMTVERSIPSSSTRLTILAFFSSTTPLALALGWCISLSRNVRAVAVIEALCAGYILYIALLQVLSRAFSMCIPSVPNPQLGQVMGMVGLGFTLSSVLSLISWGSRSSSNSW